MMKHVFTFMVVWMVAGMGLTSSISAQEDQKEAPLAAVPPEAPLSAQEGLPAAPAAQTGKVWIDDDLPSSVKQEGTWIWEMASGASGLPAARLPDGQGQAGKAHAHPSGQGMQSHGLTGDPVAISANDMITQQVWLDPSDPPQGIMMKFRLTDGKEVGVYWEGEEEVFTPGEDEEVWYYGLLPELASWTTLEILAEDLGLEGEQVSGVSFITYGGRALWDKTILTQAPPFEEVEPFAGEGEEAAPLAE